MIFYYFAVKRRQFLFVKQLNMAFLTASSINKIEVKRPL